MFIAPYNASEPIVLRMTKYLKLSPKKVNTANSNNPSAAIISLYIIVTFL